MQQQQQQMYDQQGGYGFSAQPQTMQQQQQLYRPEEEGMYDSDDGFNQQERDLETLQDEEEDESQLVPDYYIDKPPTPKFKPLPKGKDVATQIIDTELFDFELEVIPVLQVLVGKTIDQAQIELIEDSEKEELKNHKEIFTKKRNAELLKTQRMENAFLRRKEERERRDQQHKLRQEQNILAQQKLISRNLSKRCLFKMKENALDQLEDIGFLKTSVSQNIQSRFMPWLFENIVKFHNETVTGNQNIQKALVEYQEKEKLGHQDNIQKEIERKKEVLRQRELRRLELEERKKKKKEWKRKHALREEREQLYEKIEKNVALQFHKIDHILESDFTDILGDGKEGPVLGLFGGLIGQLWLVIGSIQQSGIEADQFLTEDNLNDFILKFLCEKLKHPITLNINPEYQEKIEEKIKLMEDNLAEFNKIKDEFINELIQDEKIYTHFPTINHIKNSGVLPFNIIQPVFKILLNLFFKSIDYKEQPPVDAGEQPPAAEGEEKPEEKQEQPPQEPRPEPTELDLQQVEAKKKIQLKFNSEDTYNDLEAILRVRIPFLTEEEIQREKEEELERKRLEGQNSQQASQKGEGSQQGEIENKDDELKEEEKPQEEEKQEEKELTEEEKERIKYAIYDEYVEIYDGTSYVKQLENNIQNSRRKDVSQEQPTAFLINGHKIGLIDERAELYLRQHIFQLLKEQFPEKLDNVEETTFLELCSEFSNKFQDGYIQNQPRSSEIAIYDYDLHQ